MNKKELIMSTIQKMGFSPDVDEDGDLIFLYQMKPIFVIIGDDEDPYLSIMFMQFHDIEEGEEALALAACNKLTRELKLVKVFVDSSFKSATAACEFFYANEESLEQGIRKSLHVLGVIRSLFKKNLEELSEEVS